MSKHILTIRRAKLPVGAPSQFDSAKRMATTDESPARCSVVGFVEYETRIGVTPNR
jgi:hypothetical protein